MNIIKALYAEGGSGIRTWKTKVLIDNVEIFDPDGSSLAVDAGRKLTTVLISIVIPALNQKKLPRLFEEGTKGR